MNTTTKQSREEIETAKGLFDGAEIIHSYSRKQAIADGVLIDANRGAFAEVSRQHYKYPIAMTAEVYEIINRAVNNPDWLNDFDGVWHDILWMSKVAKTRKIDPTQHEFRVMITGAGRKRWYTLKIVCGPGDDAEPVLTVMLPEQD